MKKMLTLIALTSASLVTADQYYQPYEYGSGGCSTCNGGGRYYQERSSNQGQMYNDGWRNNQYPRSNQGQRSNNGYYDGDNNQDSRNSGWKNKDSNDWNNRDNNGWNNNQDNRNNRDNNGWRNNQNYRDNNETMSNDGYYNKDNNQMNNNYENQRRDQKPNSDFEIGKRIHEKLNSGWFSKGFNGVSFRVINGDVILRGNVDTIDDKNKVEDSIRKIDGVKRINNQIRIFKEVSDNYSDSQLQDSEKKYPQDSASSSQDRQLNAKIRDKLGSGWFSNGYENLLIRTANGVVTVSGSVDKDEDIQKINAQIKDIEGVRSVNNDLNVRNK
jgi:osmotically-inducible protein OsmY